MAHPFIFIGKRKVGRGKPVFIIAEAGVNHNGRLPLAKKLIDAAAKAGADAVKFQTFNPDTLVTMKATRASYQIQNEPSKKESHYTMLKRLMLKREHHKELKRYATKKGLIFLSTPFSLDDALFLKRLGVPALKIASSDTNNLPFLSRIGKWGLPIILSTGMATLREVREAVSAIKNAGNAKLILLHCTTNYPTPFVEANVRAVETMRKEFNLPVGFSDHTIGNVAAVAAVAFGASVIEKHFTLDRNLPGPDHKASLEPDELHALVKSIRTVEMALGTGRKEPFPSEKATAKVARKSVVAARDIKRGEKFTEENLTIKRPGTGLSPRYFERIIGARAARGLAADTLIAKHDYYTS